MRARTLIGSALLALTLVAGVACGDDSGDETSTATTEAAAITISDPWCRTSPSMTDRGACYLQIENSSDEDNALVMASVPSSVAGKVELHETTAASSTDGTGMTDGTAMTDDTGMSATTAMNGEGTMTDDTASPMMEMRPVEKIELPAGETVSLEPGGYHVMLLELVAPLQSGETVQLTLTFEDGSTQTVSAEVRTS